MTSRTVSLEKSAYERLKAAKRPGESFTVTVNRILSGTAPSFRLLAGLWKPGLGREVQRNVRRMRDLEAAAERRNLRAITEVDGAHARH